MTAATGFKRLGLVLVALVLVGAGTLMAMSFVISADAVRERVKAEIRAVTGLDPVMSGPATVSLFPSGSVSFGGVVLGDNGQPALTAERLNARLRFFPLLMGRVEIADVSLVQPNIVVTVAPDGGTNWGTLIDTLARSQKPGLFPVAAFSEIRIERGTVLVRDAAHNITETLRDVELVLAWPSISKSFGASGRFVWNGEPVDASLTLSDFPAALAGNRTGVKLRLAGPPVKGAFDGAISLKPTLKIEGTLAADTASLRDAVRWAGHSPMPGGGFGRFALKAQTNVMGEKISLSNVNIELDGNNAEGVLTFVTDGRQTLQGTLATDTLDLTPYVSTIRLLTANEREWSRSRLNLDGLTALDVDLRLSAANVILSNAKLGRTAIGANLRAGQLTVTIGESQAFGGVIKGSFALTKLENSVEARSQLQFTDVDLENCLGQLVGLRKLEGKGNLAFSLEGSGESVFAITQTMSGSATLTGQKGSLTGINVEQLLRRLERRPLSGPGAFRTGRTPYDRITVGMKIAQGTVTVEDVKIEGPAVTLALVGSASIPGRDLDLKGTAALVTANQDTPSFELPFIVQGSWDDPVMLPDAEILILRSGAAAPLLKAVRDRARAREPARPVLTGTPPAEPAEAAPAAESAPGEAKPAQ